MHVEVRQLENAKHATAPDGIEEETEPGLWCCNWMILEQRQPGKALSLMIDRIESGE